MLMVCMCVVDIAHHSPKKTSSSSSSSSLLKFLVGIPLAQIKQKKWNKSTISPRHFFPLLWLDRLLAISPQISLPINPFPASFLSSFLSFLLLSLLIQILFYISPSSLSLSLSLAINTTQQYLTLSTIYNQQSTVDGRYFNSWHLPLLGDHIPQTHPIYAVNLSFFLSSFYLFSFPFANNVNAQQCTTFFFPTLPT